MQPLKVVLLVMNDTLKCYKQATLGNRLKSVTHIANEYKHFKPLSLVTCYNIDLLSIFNSAPC